MASPNETTIAECTNCGRVFAAYYTLNGELEIYFGSGCPECCADEFRDVRTIDP